MQANTTTLIVIRLCAIRTLSFYMSITAPFHPLERRIQCMGSQK
jgi:hypothetical protein